MGFINHHALVVSSWKLEAVQEAHAKAEELQVNVSSLVPYVVNGGASFMVAPDGSKEGWEESHRGDAARTTLIEWMMGNEYLEWVEVAFSPDADLAEVKRTNCSPTEPAEGDFNG